MQKIINHLVQLQELMFARAEQEATMAKSQLSQLDEAISTLTEELPEDIGTKFGRMLKKSPLSIVPIAGKNCSACGMAFPVSLVQAVRTAEQVHPCPNCGRILYCVTSVPRRILTPGRKKTDPPKVGIERFSAPELMIPHLEATDRDGAIAEICARLGEQHFVDEHQLLFEEALKREAIVSTAVDHGLAFPHVRGVEGGGLTLALAIHRKGIHFGGPSRTLTRILFFMVIPTAASAFYLKLLSGLTQAFRKDSTREKLLAAETPKQLWKVLLKATKTLIN